MKRITCQEGLRDNVLTFKEGKKNSTEGGWVRRVAEVGEQMPLKERKHEKKERQT